MQRVCQKVHIGATCCYDCIIEYILCHEYRQGIDIRKNFVIF